MDTRPPKRAMGPYIWHPGPEEGLGSSTVEAALTALASDRWKVRVEAIQTLLSSTEPRVFEVLVRTLRQDKSATVRRWAAAALGTTWKQQAVRPLCEALQDRSTLVRRWAADLIQDVEDHGDVDVGPAMIVALGDRSPLVRWRAAYFLGERGDVRALVSLRALLNDPDYSVREETGKAIKTLEAQLKEGGHGRQARGQAPEGMVLIPAGAFWMGSNEHEAEGPLHRRDVEGFYIDCYPVTNRQYQVFVEATGYPAPEGWGAQHYPEGQDDHPVVMVAWEDARSYATWTGKRLPTEVEWEKAARGPDGQLYPWGNEFDPARCHGLAAGLMGTTPVTQYAPGQSPYGVCDMAGNVWEWVEDWYQPYSGSQATDPNFGETLKVLRGGSWRDTDASIQVTTRRRTLPTAKKPFNGFRCAKDLP